MSASETSPTIIRHVSAGQICCDPQWEAAYERFETPQQEIQKFVGRLRKFGFDRLDKRSRIIELFCGRGGGLEALRQLGFQHIEGVDLSEALLQRYTGPAQLHLADCRELPMLDATYDIAIVQGGLHHLPALPNDLQSVLSETRRILKPDGRFFVVEPWMTPFLKIVHTIVEQPLMRKVYAKGDALAEMTDHERETYERWLSMPNEILATMDQYFTTVESQTSWGKLNWVGQPKRD